MTQSPLFLRNRLSQAVCDDAEQQVQETLQNDSSTSSDSPTERPRNESRLAAAEAGKCPLDQLMANCCWIIPTIESSESQNDRFSSKEHEYLYSEQQEAEVQLQAIIAQLLGNLSPSLASAALAHMLLSSLRCTAQSFQEITDRAKMCAESIEEREALLEEIKSCRDVKALLWFHLTLPSTLLQNCPVLTKVLLENEKLSKVLTKRLVALDDSEIETARIL